MHGLDLIILAIVVVILFMRLYNVLGQEDADTQKRVEKLQKIMGEILVDEEGDTAHPQERFSDFLRTRSVAERKLIKELWEQWPAFDPKKFFKGAEKAFILIIEQFSDGHLKEIKPLLSPVLYEHFQKTIEERQRKGEIHLSRVDNIRTLRMVEVRVAHEVATILVDIQSFQSYTVTDKMGKILHQTDVELEELWDRWSFTKNIQDSCPQWCLVDIQSTPESERNTK